MEEITIGKMAAEFGLTLRALRFYEDKGFLSPRREGDRRLYNADDRKLVKTILAAKRLGFTLAEVKDIINRGGIDTARRAGQLAYLENQRREIDAAIAELKAGALA